MYGKWLVSNYRYCGFSQYISLTTAIVVFYTMGETKIQLKFNILAESEKSMFSEYGSKKNYKI